MQLNEASILAVDDEQELAKVFAAWLHSLGCRRVRTAFDGDAALELMKTETFDLLISDMRMPGLDGMGLLRQMGKLGKPMPSVIFLSGMGVPDSGEMDSCEMDALGVNAVLSKPFRMEDLQTAMETALENVETATLES